MPTTYNLYYFIFEDLNELDQKFKKALARQKHDLTEDALNELMEQHRHQRLQLIRQRESGKRKIDDKLQAKLASAMMEKQVCN